MHINKNVNRPDSLARGNITYASVYTAVALAYGRNVADLAGNYETRSTTHTFVPVLRISKDTSSRKIQFSVCIIHFLSDFV
jgi:hypothetical protein